MNDEVPKKPSKRGTNPISLANLRPPFPPGVSPNPGGGVKGKKLSTCLRDMMDLDEEKLMAVVVDPKRTMRDRIAAKWAIKMLGRDANLDVDMRAIETALDRLEGSVAQTMNVKNPADRSGKSLAELAAIAARFQGSPKPPAGPPA